MINNNWQKILDPFGLQATRVLPSEKGYRNKVIPIVVREVIAKEAAQTSATTSLTTSQICLVIYKDEPQILAKIKRANFLSDYLASQNFPTKKTLVNLSGQTIFKLSSKQQSRYACLYNYLPGQTISWDAYTQKHLKLLGKSMAIIHQQLAQLKTEKLTTWPKAQQIFLTLNHQMQLYFAQKDVQLALTKKLKLNILKPQIFIYFEKILKQLSTLPNQQALHLDFVRSNLLFTQNIDTKDESTTNSLFQFKNLTLTGILDWEKTAFGDPIIDVARTLAFLLVDCQYKNPNQIIKYFVHSGYQKYGESKLSPTQMQLLAPLVKFFLFYDFYKFLKHNPYESLEQNEHFVRTKTWIITNSL